MTHPGKTYGERGRFVIEQEIGRGAMGLVFRGRDQRMRRPVVVKLLSPELAGNASARRRIVNEALIQGSVTHPNIVRAVDIIDELVAWAQERCRLLYAGEQVAHRSCGIALAETFGRAPQPYQALRRGGLTGHGTCGALQAGLLILGEVFGDPDPTGPATETLQRAAARYRELWQAELGLAGSSTVCNDLVSGFADFRGPQRHAFCTSLASRTARCVARTILELGGSLERLAPPPS